MAVFRESGISEARKTKENNMAAGGICIIPSLIEASSLVISAFKNCTNAKRYIGVLSKSKNSVVNKMPRIILFLCKC